MVEAEIVLGALEALLDRPAQARDPSKLGERRPRWSEDEVIGLACRISPVPADQEKRSNPSGRVQGNGIRAQSYRRNPFAPSPAA